MPAQLKALASVKDFTLKSLENTLATAFDFKKNGFPTSNKNHVVMLAFFEPSTRTRASFEVAAHRLNFKPVNFAADETTSVKKGESLHETLETLLAMRPDMLICRHSGDENLNKLLSQCPVPYLNAGDGKNEHPTQAVLDVMTVQELRGQIKGERVLYVGDVEHSRVARSGRMAFEMLGAEVAMASPLSLKPKSQDWAKNNHFTTLKEALDWATVCIGLRVQKERHANSSQFSQAEYIEQFRLDQKNLKPFRADGVIMHPGPFVPEEDLSEAVLADSRTAIHEQVTNGVFVRAAIMAEILGVHK